MKMLIITIYIYILINIRNFIIKYYTYMKNNILILKITLFLIASCLNCSVLLFL